MIPKGPRALLTSEVPDPTSEGLGPLGKEQGVLKGVGTVVAGMIWSRSGRCPNADAESPLPGTACIYTRVRHLFPPASDGDLGNLPIRSFQKFGVFLRGCPSNKSHSILGSILEPPICRNCHVKAFFQALGSVQQRTSW